MPNPASMNEKMKNFPPFYQKVWKACATIPKGETRTYAWIAKQIGNPRAARAVGRALGANPFAPDIPCHRVIGANGALGGYGGNLHVKRSLLRAEGLDVGMTRVRRFDDVRWPRATKVTKT